MLRKFACLLSAIIVVMCVFSSCGGKQQEGPVTLTIWHDKEDAVAEALQKELDKLKPDIVVNLEKKNGLTEALKMVGNDPSAAPDMYFFAHDKLGVYAEMGILEPITSFVNEKLLEEFVPMTVKAATYKEKIYQLPIYFETLLFIYNQDLMKQDKVPATTEELYSYMQKNNSDNRYGFVEQHSTAYYSAGWIHGFGGEIISNDGKPQLNSEKVIDALKYHLKFTKMMPGESEYATVNTLFREGKAASTIGGPWLVSSVRDSGMKLALAPMPVVEETGLPLAPYSGVQGIHVLKVAADNPTKNAAIKKLLNQLVSTDIGVSMAKASGCAPAYQACYEQDEVKNDDIVMMMYEMAQNAVPMPNIPEMDVMFNVTGNLLVDINMRGKEIQQAANEAQASAEELISAMK